AGRVLPGRVRVGAATLGQRGPARRRLTLTMSVLQSVPQADPERVRGDIDQVDLRCLDTDAIAIVSDRTRQSCLRDSDEAGGDDHRGCRNSSVAHGVVPNPNSSRDRAIATIVCDLVAS